MSEQTNKTIGLTGIAALEAEMRDRLAAKDARIATLTDQLTSLQADPPPDGYPSWEDWLMDFGIGIIRSKGQWFVVNYEREDQDTDPAPTPYPDYPSALAAAKKEVTHANEK